MNRKTACITDEQFDKIIDLLENGSSMGIIKPNKEIALVLTVTGNCGLRIGDCLNLKLSSFIKEGNEYKYNIKEDKTGKARTFVVPNEIYNLLSKYAKDNNIKIDNKLFRYTERNIQKKLKQIREYLGDDYKDVSTHSFRKCAAMRIYRNSGNNIELTRKYLNHSSISVTQKYLGVSDDDVNEVIRNSVHIRKGA
jgi:integrase